LFTNKYTQYLSHVLSLTQDNSANIRAELKVFLTPKDFEYLGILFNKGTLEIIYIFFK